MSGMKDKLDRLDMQILSRLLNNCRESERQIGEGIGIASGTVNARIRRMRRRGIILDFVVRVDPPTLGHSTLYTVVLGQRMEEMLGHMAIHGGAISGSSLCGRV